MSKSNSNDRSGLFIPAGIFIGMGVGMIIGELPAGIFLGIGIGFLAMALVKVKRK